MPKEEQKKWKQRFTYCMNQVDLETQLTDRFLEQARKQREEDLTSKYIFNPRGAAATLSAHEARKEEILRDAKLMRDELS